MRRPQMRNKDIFWFRDLEFFECSAEDAVSVSALISLWSL